MNSTGKVVLAAGVSAVVAVGILVGGFYLGRSSVPQRDWDEGAGAWPPRMSWTGPRVPDQRALSDECGARMRNEPAGFPMGPRMGPTSSNLLREAEPLEVEQAERAAEEYLTRLGYEDLAIGEVMIFKNHAYLQVMEPETGMGAMELLVDPIRVEAYPEHGPNRMWNVKYGHMAVSAGGMGMGGRMSPAPGVDLEGFENEIDAESAVELAQDYLDRVDSDLTADDHGTAFYGYYTFHTLKAGQVQGMLSVNGFTGEVFPHGWHGELLTLSGH